MSIGTPHRHTLSAGKAVWYKNSSESDTDTLLAKSHLVKVLLSIFGVSKAGTRFYSIEPKGGGP